MDDGLALPLKWNSTHSLWRLIGEPFRDSLSLSVFRKHFRRPYIGAIFWHYKEVRSMSSIEMSHNTNFVSLLRLNVQPYQFTSFIINLISGPSPASYDTSLQLACPYHLRFAACITDDTEIVAISATKYMWWWRRLRDRSSQMNFQCSYRLASAEWRDGDGQFIGLERPMKTEKQVSCSGRD